MYIPVLLHNIKVGDKIQTIDGQVFTVKEIQFDIEPKNSIIYVFEGKGGINIMNIVKVGE